MHKLYCRDCNGEIDTFNPIVVRISCCDYSIGFPCKGCGRLYSQDGGGFFDRSPERKKIYYKDGKIFVK